MVLHIIFLTYVSEFVRAESTSNKKMLPLYIANELTSQTAVQLCRRQGQVYLHIFHSDSLRQGYKHLLNDPLRLDDHFDGFLFVASMHMIMQAKQASSAHQARDIQFLKLALALCIRVWSTDSELHNT